MVDVNIRLKTQGSEEVKRGISSVDKAVADLRAEILRLDGTADSNLLDFRMDVAQAEIKDTIKDAQKLRQELEKPIELKIESSSTRGALFNADQIKNQKDSFGDTSTGLSAIGSGLGAISPGVGSTLQSAGDIAGALEGLPVLVQGISSIGLAALPIAGITAAAAGGLFLLNKELDKQTKLITELAADERKRVDALIQTREDLRSLTATDARQQIEDLQFQIQANQQGRDTLVQQFSANIGTITGFGDAVTTSLSGLGSALGINVGQIGAAKDALKEWNDGLATNQAELDRLTNDVLPALERRASSQAIVDALLEEESARVRLEETIRTGTAAQVQDRLQSIDIEQRAAEEAKQQADERIKLFYEEKKAQIELYNSYIQRGGAEAQVGQDRLNLLLEEIKPFEQVSQQLGDTLSSLAAEEQALNDTALPLLQAREREKELLDQITDATKRRNEAQVKLKQLEENLVNTIAAEKEKRAKQELTNQRKAEDEALNAQEASLKQQLEQQKKAQQASALAVEQRSKLQDVDRKFFDTQLKLFADYRKQEEQLEARANLERLQRLRRNELSLREAVEDNDIVSFVRQSREFALSELESRENSDLAGQERAGAFKSAIDEAAVSRQQEIEQVRTSYQQRLQTTSEGENAITQQITAIQEQRRALQIQRQQADESVRAQVDRAAFANQINEYQRQRSELMRVLVETNRDASQATALIAQNMTRSYAASLQSFNPFSGGSRTPSAQIAYSRYGQVGRTITAAAEGDIFPGNKPQLVLLGDAPYPEAVMPLKPSRGFGNAAASMGFGSPINVYLTANVGEITKPSDLDALEQRVYQGVIQAQKMARQELSA